MSTVPARIYRIFCSRRFFQVTLGFFIFEALWFVFSAAYPMAFDEDFHFGLIQVYSHYWLPFLTNQPARAAAYGAVARDPSYLYHYLMSFPYRLTALWIHGQTGQVIALRLMNVAMFSGGLMLFRRVLRRAGLSVSLTNVIFLIFALIPIAAQLAAHINYDNLLFPLVAWVCLLAMRATDEIRAGRPTARTLLTLLSVCLFTSIVKYAFLPIFVAVVLYLVILAYWHYHGRRAELRKQLWRSFGKQSVFSRILLVMLCLLGFAMLLQRDGINLISYHELVPDCGDVLSKQSCSQYPVWYYTYSSHQAVLSAKHQQVVIEHYNPITYLGAWLYWMWYRLFFVINGPTSGFENYPPLPLPSATAALLGISGIVLIVKYWRRLFQHNAYLLLFLAISLAYTLALLADGYTAYRYTNVLQTMNGRYLLPILLLMAAIFGSAFSQALRHATTRKTILAAVVLLLFLQGGGVMTFITRSSAGWDWPNHYVVAANNAARAVLKPLVVKGSKYYHTSVWVFN